MPQLLTFYHVDSFDMESLWIKIVNKIQMLTNEHYILSDILSVFCKLWFISIFKCKSPGVPFHRITSQYSWIIKEIWIFAPIQQGTEKTWSWFALNTEDQYWTVTVQYPCVQSKENYNDYLAMFCLSTLWP